MSGEIVFFDLPSHDVDTTSRFWGALFGWTFTTSNAPGYSMIEGSRPMAGAPHGDPSSHPRVYFGVDDVDEATTRVRELGGTAEEPVTIPSGRFVHCADDQGVRFSLFQERVAS